VRNRLLWLAAVVVLVAVLGMVWTVTWMLPATKPHEPAAEPVLRPAQDATIDSLKQQLEERDEQIADLQSRIRKLEDEQRALRSEVQRSAAEAVAADEPPPESVSAAVPQRAADPVALESATDWLRRVLPDKYGKLTAEEAEMITDLDLRGAKITDEDLRNIAALTHLRNLSLRGAQITDAGVAYLEGLVGLETLELRGTAVTGTALPYLPGRDLTALHLTDTKVTGADLYRLPPMPKLEKLKLNFLDVGDDAIDIIGSYPTVRHLEMDRTKITDDGLRRLLELNPQLQRIELRGTQISGETLQALRSTYPGCTFVFEQASVPYFR